MSIKVVQNDFKTTMDKMLDTSRAPKAGFARIYKLYQKFQTERFQTSGGSERPLAKSPWKSLTKEYADKKLKQFKSYPGGGRKIGIATGTLAGAVIGPGAPFSGTDKHRAQFTTKSMIIEVELSGKNAAGKPFNYGSYFDEERPLMEFNPKHLDQMQDELSKFIFGE